MPARRRPTRRALDLRNVHVRAVLGDRGWGRGWGRPGGPARGARRPLRRRRNRLAVGLLLYIDESADEPQREALTEIFLGRAGGGAATRRGSPTRRTIGRARDGPDGLRRAAA